eukprot:5054040-Prorocentrum_lima.AAC.1
MGRCGIPGRAGEGAMEAGIAVRETRRERGGHRGGESHMEENGTNTGTPPGAVRRTEGRGWADGGRRGAGGGGD